MLLREGGGGGRERQLSSNGEYRVGVLDVRVSNCTLRRPRRSSPPARHRDPRGASRRRSLSGLGRDGGRSPSSPRASSSRGVSRGGSRARVPRPAPVGRVEAVRKVVHGQLGPVCLFSGDRAQCWSQPPLIIVHHIKTWCMFSTYSYCYLVPKVVRVQY